MSCSCGCCVGGSGHVSAGTANPSGQSLLRYRIGRYGSFLDEMIRDLSDSDSPALGMLRTRMPSDPAMAFLDAGATLFDILTFYQERIATEGYLRTAIERRSLLELARLVGYRPRPGLAASVHLAFTVQKGHRLTVPVGTQAQSVPGQDETAQTFETSVPLEARAEWNQLSVRRRQPQLVPVPDPTGGPGAVLLWFKGTSTGLRRNDPLLLEIPNEKRPRLFRVESVDIESTTGDPMVQRTRVALRPWPTPGMARMARDIGIAFFMAGSANSGTNIGSKVLAMLEKLIKESMAAMAKEAMKAADFEILKEVTQMLPDLQKILSDLPSTATVLRPWMTELVDALESAVKLAEVELAPVARTVADAPFAFETTAKALALPGAVGRASTATIARTLDAGLTRQSGATLGVVAAFQPALQSVLPALLANARVAPPSALRAHALRVKASLFGYNAPRKLTGFDKEEKTPEYEVWTAGDMREVEDEGVLCLDARYDAIAPGSWVVVDTSGVTPTPNRNDPQVAHHPLLIARAESVLTIGARSAYGLTGPSTTVTIAGDSGLPSWILLNDQGAVPDFFIAALRTKKVSEGPFEIIRRTGVFAGSELLELDDAPIDDCIGGDTIELSDLQLDLQPGRWIIVSGEGTDVPGTSGVMASELREIAGVAHDVGRDGGTARDGESIHTFLTLATPLDHCYRRDTVVVWGNVIDATHGETKRETLGGGDGTQAFQQFTLRAWPVTYTAAANADGAASTLEERVNEVLWHEHRSFADATPAERAYVTTTADDGKMTITHGDGVRGARLPTGRENIKAVYRVGIGRAANLGANRITLLASRPLGLTDVVNPMASSGGADPDSIEQLRRNLPLGLQALDRLVSLRDYADFARASAGIGKAVVSMVPDGRRELVHVTIAGVDDIPILPSSDLFINLQAAFERLGDRRQPTTLAVRELVLLVIAARIRIAPDYSFDLVKPHVRAALLARFSFDQRELGQAAHSSEVIATIAAVPGVAYVDLETFGGIPEVVASVPPATPSRDAITPDKIAELVAERVQVVPPAAASCGWLPPFCSVSARLAGLDENGLVAPAQLAILSSAVPATLVLTEIP